VTNNTRELPLIYLRPGEMHVTKRPKIIMTVLGSCLSVTMFDRRRGLGGICHGLLPQCSGRKTCDGECLDGFRYVDCTILQMIQLFDRYGVPRSEIEVKCFGGADMFIGKNTRKDLVSIGRKNIIAAEKMLRSEGLTLRVKDVGGTRGRKILFNTQTGEVLLKRLNAVNNQDIMLEKFEK
jgi:chemotaxis protein CheD